MTMQHVDASIYDADDVDTSTSDTVSMYDLLPSYDRNGSGNHNGSDIDITVTGCFSKNFDTIACIRNGTISAIVAITGVLCVVKLMKLHARKHPTVHQYIIFYCATLECILCAVHWMLGMYPQFDFITQWLKLVQFLVCCHFYWTLATRAMRREKLTNRVLIPILGLCLIYFTVVTVLGVVFIRPKWKAACLQIQWLMLSAAEFVVVQLFMIAGFYVTRRLNEISTLQSVRRAQKRDLWSVIIVFELSALAGLVYDATMKALGDDVEGCSMIFFNKQELYSPIFGVFMLVKFVLPIWTMLCVFHPMEVAPDNEDLLPGLSEDGTYTSAFSPGYDRPRFKQMYYPGSESSPDSDFSPTASGHTSPLTRSTSSMTPIQEETVPSKSSIQA